MDTVGVIGGGQLARMMIPAAIALGVRIRVLAETEDMSASLAATMVGDYTDLDTVRAFAAGVDVVTFDHEHVPQRVLQALVADGVRVEPGPEALVYAQDKAAMRRRLGEAGLPMPDWAPVTSLSDLDRFLAAHGGTAVLKTARGGYDGHGVRVVTAGADANEWLAALAADDSAGSLLVEEKVDFRREPSQQVARRPSGEVAVYPVVETIQQDGVCAQVIAPAPETSDAVARECARIGRGVAEQLGVTGMLAVELFETTDGRVLVNELAMRPHTSGHWSIDGAVTGQFEQHLRAVLDLPLGDP
ncbi:MAG TPA: 5-(carboxyamino)imidazole ribonucleotide synthase, partial [Microbacteriaceae bacterium]|nr:5-(carboxyamino)imidazole ribonucleotide synthase [Microbacteriaceae bacterium]